MPRHLPTLTIAVCLMAVELNRQIFSVPIRIAGRYNFLQRASLAEAISRVAVLGLLILLLLIAAVAGNTVNYMIGRAIGPRVFNSHIPFLERFLDRRALQKTHDFYEKHGGKTIVLARFIPVVRTFAPFVAGASSMTFSRFQLFNFIGAFLWVLLLMLLGYFFGNIPFIRQYLNVIVLVGIGAAVVPVLLGALWKMVRKDGANAGNR